MKAVESMRQDWDERARQDAFHYIASWRSDWTEESFFESGEKDYETMVAPVLARRCWQAADKTMLELGCGTGRMTKTFAERFGRVVAVDISTEMLARAKALLPEARNITWTLGNGSDLSVVPGASMDFVFSYIVLQHMPTRELTLVYIGELLRVLKPGGIFLFQFNSLARPSMNWRGRLVWGAVDLPWSLGWIRASRSLASAFGLNPALAGKSWRGVALDAATVQKTVQTSGGIVEEVTGEGTDRAWCSGTKCEPKAQ
jgi:SAM-dependent methyltransferase